jgi:hypothetical protein
MQLGLSQDEKKTGSGMLTNAAPLLAGGQVEPRLDMPLPIFSDIVMTLLCFTISPSLPATRHKTIQSHQINFTKQASDPKLARSTGRA